MTVRRAQPLRRNIASAQSTVAGQTLGIKTSNVSRVACLLKAGLGYAAIERLQRKSGFTLNAIAQVMQISPSTRQRRKLDGKFTQYESERLFRIAAIFEEALVLFNGDNKAARRWLCLPSAFFENKSPLTMIETEVGAREVQNFIGRLEHGVFT